MVAVTDICKEIAETLEKKRADYGPADKTIGRFGVKGISIRIVDKTERLISLTWHNKEPHFESVEDTLKDLAGYAILGLQLLREDKKP